MSVFIAEEDKKYEDSSQGVERIGHDPVNETPIIEAVVKSR